MDKRKMRKSQNFEDRTSWRNAVQFRLSREEGLEDKWKKLEPGNSWFNKTNLRKKRK